MVLSIGVGTGHEDCNDEGYIHTEARGNKGGGNSSYTPVPDVKIKIQPIVNTSLLPVFDSTTNDFCGITGILYATPKFQIWPQYHRLVSRERNFFFCRINLAVMLLK